MKRILLFPMFAATLFAGVLFSPSSAEAACAGSCKAACTTGEISSGTCSVAAGDPTTGVCCIASETTDPATTETFEFANPLKYDTVQEVLGVALQAMKNVIVLLALVFLVLGAVLYIVSSGNDKMIGTAKKMILAAMVGLAIGIAAPSFLKEIATILDWGGTGEEIPTEVQEAQTLSDIAGNTLNFLLSMTGILGIVMIVVGGLMYFAAAGDEKRADTAKKIVTFSIVGVAVALSALIIVRTIANFFIAS